MKKLLAVALTVALLATYSGIALAANDMPNGPHYNLNIIGMSKEKKNVEMNNNGHRIFVNLWKKSTIWLYPAPEGESFRVLDANATDKDGGAFQLPLDVAATYCVWVRALGKPGGEAIMVTCAWDPVAEEEVCGTAVIIIREKGKPKKQNVTYELLTIDGVPLFDESLVDYLWYYDNKGLKVAQLRFYPL